MMNNMIGNNIASIEKMTDIIGKKNSDNVDKMYNGKTFADIYNQKRSIEEVISDSDIKSSKGLSSLNMLVKGLNREISGYQTNR